MKIVTLTSVVAAAALAAAGAASAAFAPHLYVGANSAGAIIKVTGNVADDPVAKVTVYAPLGATLRDRAPAGTNLGPVTAQARIGDLGGAVAPLTGSLISADPSQFAGPPNNVCVPGAHAQVWLLTLTAAGQTLTIPAYVDPTTGPEATFASIKIQVCLPPPDVPTGTPGRAPLGAKLINAVFNTSEVAPAPAGSVWRSIWTPYTPGNGQPNVAGTVEAQSKASGVAAATLAAKKNARTKVVALTAKVTQDGAPVAGATVKFLLAGKSFATKKTGAAGTATASVKVKRAATFSATASTPDVDLGAAGCTTTVPGSPYPCIGSGTLGLGATSNKVTVKK